jgi:hypothetical protein
MRQQCPIRLNMPPRNAVLFFNSVHGVVMLCVPHQASSSMLVLRTSLSHLICVSSASQRRISTMPSQLPKSRPVYSWSIVRVCPQYWKAVICSPLFFGWLFVIVWLRLYRRCAAQNGTSSPLSCGSGALMLSRYSCVVWCSSGSGSGSGSPAVVSLRGS